MYSKSKYDLVKLTFSDRSVCVVHMCLYMLGYSAKYMSVYVYVCVCTCIEQMGRNRKQVRQLQQPR